MRDIVAYYKRRIVPGLTRLIIKSDGCAGQYKGKCNFKHIGTFHLQKVGRAALRAAAEADRQTAAAAFDQERKRLQMAASITRSAIKTLSQAEIAARVASEFKAPDMVRLPRVLRHDFADATRSSSGEAEAALDILQVHDFPQSHHYAGPHDNAGKAPRTRMRRSEAFENDRISDYHECYKFCIKNMPRYI